MCTYVRLQYNCGTEFCRLGPSIGPGMGENYTTPDVRILGRPMPMPPCCCPLSTPMHSCLRTSRHACRSNLSKGDIWTLFAPLSLVLLLFIVKGFFSLSNWFWPLELIPHFGAPAPVVAGGGDSATVTAQCRSHQFGPMMTSQAAPPGSC